VLWYWNERKIPSKFDGIIYIFNMEEILPKIQKAFHESFGIEATEVTLETAPAAVPGWDSMGHLTLANNLEQAFVISFGVDELMEMESVKAIVRIIQGKLKAA
jgi:acyl carrier protein